MLALHPALTLSLTKALTLLLTEDLTLDLSEARYPGPATKALTLSLT